MYPVDVLSTINGSYKVRKGLPKYDFFVFSAGCRKWGLSLTKNQTVCSKNIRNLYPNAKISSDTFGLHLLGSYREKWLNKLQGNAHRNEKEISVQDTIFQPCQKQDIFGYTGRQAKRWVNTRLNIW